MQTPNQPPQEEQKPISEPFYEFPEGIMYPPPPSFYQNLPDTPERAPLPVLPPSAQPFPPMGGFPGPHRGSTSLEERKYEGRGQPVPFVPPSVPQAPMKKSRRWLWIIVAILSITILASCGLCSWAAYGLFSQTFDQVSGALQVVNDYYAAIQVKNYSLAYHDLALQGTMSGLTFEQFHEQATSRDAQYGPVLSYRPGTPSYQTDPTTGPDLSHLSFTVEVSRSKLNYTVLLTVSKIGGQWKITDFDRI